ncbi:fructosamine kinase family protein [Poseidonocella sp. HB161398]|uniref:fructosamine kinase family protein n=1 Tax=Poseidonocella sp. HB161398 TaxID=2320855 RepID=UPI00110811EB|nr:fructosamine kinase family protein [Poseidonocella sp. HB161398]
MSRAAGLARALPGAELARLLPLSGGDLSEISRADLADGRSVVLKTGPLARAEARMLSALAGAGARVPRVLGTDDGLLVLEWLEPAPASAPAWEDCGAMLRRLHDRHGAAYGWEEDFAFGPVAIANAPLPDWPSFWAERRLAPALPHLPARLARRVEALCTRLPERLPARPAASLLHGDLWSGNLHFTAPGAALIDPACYHGDAEADLAMLALFGRIPAAFLEGYGPLAPGWETRRPLYQLWPALVHVQLFGAGYLGLAGTLLERCQA